MTLVGMLGHLLGNPLCPVLVPLPLVTFCLCLLFGKVNRNDTRCLGHVFKFRTPLPVQTLSWLELRTTCAGILPLWNFPCQFECRREHLYETSKTTVWSKAFSSIPVWQFLEAQVNGMAVPTGSEFVLEMFVGVPHYTLLTRRPPSLAVEHSLLDLFVLKPPLLAQGSVESAKTSSHMSLILCIFHAGEDF